MDKIVYSKTRLKPKINSVKTLTYNELCATAITRIQQIFQSQMNIDTCGQFH
jgi:hypothetical protein